MDEKNVQQSETYFFVSNPNYLLSIIRFGEVQSVPNKTYNPS